MNSGKQLLKPYYHLLQRTLKLYRRIGLYNRNFTIISNNCTAGYIYQYFGLPYNTPTAGLFFEAGDYVKLVSEPTRYFKDSKLEFIDPWESKNILLYKSSDTFGSYPVAKLNDIEIYFIHYKDKEEAENVWNRRAMRINYDNLFFLFTENESFTIQTLVDFLKIPGANKFCLVNQDYEIQNSYIKIDIRAAKGGGNLSWSPSIVLSAIKWKKVLNKLKKKKFLNDFK